MKTTTLNRFMSVLLVILSCSLGAQNYNFTLVDNGNYSYTIAAESLFDSGGFAPVTQSYGFVLVVPDGVTITLNEVLPSGTSETVTPIPGSNVAGIDPSMSDKDLFLVTTDTAGRTISAHANAAVIPLVTLTVNGNPTSGEIRLLSNSSTLASAPAINGSLDAFFQIDITDDSTVNFTNEYNMLGSTAAINFGTLSIDDAEIGPNSLVLYPNPADQEINIRSKGLMIETVEIFELNGKRVIKVDRPLGAIDVSQLESATYLVIIQTDKGNTIKKLVKE
ncbi:T9SS type A sorting domain-containing protein [Winogradskyella sp.]|uniref:T9SS type A sorting domain-containing protein n=1 Tax=Winogradskyella sp. TaxID=1883156 RepID=UPI003BABE0FC